MKQGKTKGAKFCGLILTSKGKKEKRRHRAVVYLVSPSVHQSICLMDITLSISLSFSLFSQSTAAY